MALTSRHAVRALLAPLLLSGCIEQGITNLNEVVGVPNPAGLGDVQVQDRIVQVQTPEVDVLWVVDNSCSMQAEQDALTANFPLFMNYFLGSGLDYHVGVVSTDMDNDTQQGRLLSTGGKTWIDSSTPDPVSTFSSLATLGTGGSGYERGRDATYWALEIRNDEENAGFLRPAATLSVVVISDEEDDSDDVTLNEFILWLRGLKWSQDMVSFSSIVSQTEECPLEIGTDYMSITSAMGGITWDICSERWDALLDQLGLQAAGLRREFFLSQLPVPGSISVSIVEGDVTFSFIEGEDWEYDPQRNSVVFLEYIPDPMAQIFIDYTLLSSLEEAN